MSQAIKCTTVALLLFTGTVASAVAGPDPLAIDAQAHRQWGPELQKAKRVVERSPAKQAGQPR